MIIKETIKELLKIIRLTYSQTDRFAIHGYMGDIPPGDSEDDISIYSCNVMIREYTIKFLREMIFEHNGIEICDANGKLIDEFRKDIYSITGTDEELNTMNDIMAYMDDKLPEFYSKYKITEDLTSKSRADIFSFFLLIKYMHKAEMEMLESEDIHSSCDVLKNDAFLTIGLSMAFISEIAYVAMRYITFCVMGKEVCEENEDLIVKYDDDYDSFFVVYFEYETFSDIKAVVLERSKGFCELYGI